MRTPISSDKHHTLSVKCIDGPLEAPEKYTAQDLDEFTFMIELGGERAFAFGGSYQECRKRCLDAFKSGDMDFKPDILVFRNVAKAFMEDVFNDGKDGEDVLAEKLALLEDRIKATADTPYVETKHEQGPPDIASRVASAGLPTEDYVGEGVTPAPLGEVRRMEPESMVAEDGTVNVDMTDMAAVDKLLQSHDYATVEKRLAAKESVLWKGLHPFSVSRNAAKTKQERINLHRARKGWGPLEAK